MPIDPGQLLNLAYALSDADRFPYLATTDGDQPRLRPVSPVRTEGFTAYLANLRQYHKTAEPAANPKVAPRHMNDARDQVRITGTARTPTDTRLMKEIRDTNKLLRQYPGSIDNPDQRGRPRLICHVLR